MNLHCNTNPEALIALIGTADKSISAHHIAMDYDGEILIDPEIHYPHVDVRRYKFCTMVKDAAMQNSDMLHELHETLLNIFEGKGRYMDFGTGMSQAA